MKKILTLLNVSIGLICLIFYSSTTMAKTHTLPAQWLAESFSYASNLHFGAVSSSNTYHNFNAGEAISGINQNIIYRPVEDIQADNNHVHEAVNVPLFFPFATTACFPGTGNRFTGSYHSNLYIGNTGGTNVLLAWGQVMLDYTGTGTGNITSPTVVSALSYTGVPLEVRSASSGGAAGLSSLVLRTSSKLYFFGTAANLTAITSYPGFGGAALTTAASDVTLKLPTGVLITDIAQTAISQTAFVIVTNSGDVYVLTKVLNLQGDNAVAATNAVWHHVVLAGGTTGAGPYLTGVTKISVSGSGILAATASNRLYYWGAPANVSGVTNTATSYKYAFDMSAQIPAGQTVKDVVVLGTKLPSSSTLFLLCNNNKVYGCGLNTAGVLGINNATVTFNQATFITVKGTDGLTDLSNIIKIDGDTEADIFTMGAQSTTGQIYGWGDSPAGMLGINGTTSSFTVQKTIQLYIPTPNVNFTDFSIAGHFTIAFYSSGTSDQYWYLGHNTGGSVGNPANTTAYILAAAPAPLNSSGGVTFDCSSALPLTWLSFTAEKSDIGLLLKWSTTNEQNTKDFLVQNSSDGLNWTLIGRVQSAGNSLFIENYSFLHPSPGNGINYYRLLQQDQDGNGQYSKTIIAAYSTRKKDLILYPNINSDGKLTLQLFKNAAVAIYNSAGMLVMRKQIPAGIQTLNVSAMPRGMYILYAGNETKKFILQ